MKKITTIIATNRKAVVRKATILGGVILGIGIGLLMNKAEEEDMVIINNEEHDVVDGELAESAQQEKLEDYSDEQRYESS